MGDNLGARGRTVVRAIDGFQRRHRWAGFPISVVYKYADDQGGFLAALITYYGLLSLFPALLLLMTVLGYVLSGDPAAQQRVIDSALGKFPIIGSALKQNIHAIHGSGIAALIGVVGLIYGVLGVGQALQQTFNQSWAVPRNQRPDPFRSRLRSLLLVVLAGLVLITTTGLTAVGAATGSLDSHLGGVLRLVVLAGSVVTNLLLFLAAFRLLTAREVTMRALLPGAITGALGWQALQALGTTYVSRVLSHSTDIYGAFGVLLGLIAWIYLGAVLIVIATEMNVVHACRLSPRSLLAPFADGLPLTPADERAYVSYVEMCRHKSFQNIDVSFDEPSESRR